MWFWQARSDVGVGAVVCHWFDAQTADPKKEKKEKKAKKPKKGKKGGKARMLADEFGEDMEVFTPEEYFELFGVEPERFASEMNFDQD